MRLLYVANARLPTEKAHGLQIAKMCEAFARRGVEVELWHPRRTQPDWWPDAPTLFDYYGVLPSFTVRTLANVDVVRLGRRLGERGLRTAFAGHAVGWALVAACLARRRRADLHYTRDAEVAFWLTALGLPTVVEVHRLAGGPRGRLIPAAARRAAMVRVAPLTAAARDALVAAGVDRAKTEVLPSGVDVDAFRSLPPKEACRRTLGLPARRRLVGYVGRFHSLEQEKGVADLIRAMADSRLERALDADLVCVGGPADRVPAYRELAQGLGLTDGRVRFQEAVPPTEVGRWMKAMDVCVLAPPRSLRLGDAMSPLKLFEYMAAGVPIVATDLPGVSEVLEHRRTGWLAAAGDPRSLAEGIAALLGDRRLAGRLARAAMAEAPRYSWDERARRALGQ